MNFFKTTVLLTVMTMLFMGAGYLIGGQQGMWIALAIAAAMNVFSWWNSGSMVLRMHNAHPVDETSAPELFGMVRDLADNAGLPMPKVYIIETDQPNAFATGRNPENGAVAVSRGLLDRLSGEEVAAVVAHELAHIRSRDTLVMTVTATLAGAIGMLANFAFFFRGDRNNPLGFIGVLATVILAPLAAGIVQMAISRTREYEADRDGAEICGNPLWLASALDKIARNASRIVNHRAESAKSTAHLFIINPLNGQTMDSLFSTHPATENRIAALQELHRQWQQIPNRPAQQRQQAPETEVWGRDAGKPRRQETSTRSSVPISRRGGPWS